ncbi:TBC1 domain family member 1 isoform X2 [Crotalus tigris]|uniref:TBC1 domain family member 1 isoform X2 n=1 Tax=Crotalus tigris TaxID=88082 RepID=UPI00192F9482|nr:TBC1 domain family member 1 isoform X2 [Crotalus tigris]
MEPVSFRVKNPEASSDGSVDFRLQLIGSLPVHPLTTMPMLPWIVAQIRLSTQPLKEDPAASRIRIYVSPARIRCEADSGNNQQWDPLICSSLFECRPQNVHKLIHNSHDPSYFACLIRDGATNEQSICYVFKAEDQTKVPEIISTIRQAGKIARQEELQNQLSDVQDHFSKKFEVLFCGRVTVAHKNAPPALIDECIEKFNDVSYTQKLDAPHQNDTADHSSSGFFISDKFRSVLQPLVSEEQGAQPMRKSYSQPGLRSFAFKRDLQTWSRKSNSLARSLDDDEVLTLNLKSQFIQGQNVQPTDIAGNRIMLFMIGQSEVYIISPETKKVVIEKSFKEISFCSQGIRHVDHFGFICREPSKHGGFHFVCYVFQCAEEALVDEIMMTLKQAFSVAAIQQNFKAQLQFCDECPMQILHKLCEKIEGTHPSKIKLELQKHLTALNNQEQASIFEEVQKIRPRNEQKENELIVSMLRSMYEEKQKDHVHLGDVKQATQSSVEALGNEMPNNTTRFKLDMLKSKAKRSLTESLENILSRGNKSKSLQETSGSIDLDSSISSTLSNISKDTSVGDQENHFSLESPLNPNGSVDNLDLLSTMLEGPSEEHLAQSAYQGFRRRANTLTHVPLEIQEPSESAEASPSVSQRKLLRYHSMTTETPDHQNQPSATSALPPPARLHSSASSPNFFKRTRHSSSGEQGRHAMSKSTSYRSSLQQKLHSCSSVPNFLKFLAPVDENVTSDFRKSTRDNKSKPKEADLIPETPVKARRHSWRQQIFLRVATPQKGCDSSGWHEDYSELGELPPRSPLLPVCEDGPFGATKEDRKRTPKELRELWQKAILQQILLLRMEKENRKLQASENNLLNKRLKLDYEEVTPCLKEVMSVWDKMLTTPGRSKVKFDMDKIHTAVEKGVPRQQRGEIWKFLAELHQLKHPFPNKQQPKDTPYKELLKQLTSQQHAILIDLGRTFPTHPYFSAQLGAGQLSLYNILKAYSLLDQEVSYCQGLSFVAGVLLLHMSEEEAFNMLKFLMFDMGLRKQYRPMTIVQIQMYQLSRLLHDYHKDLYNHFEANEISPSLYAAPWFLTVFASQFPLGFVARVFDMMFLQGSEVIVKVALSLLGSHKLLILQHENLETIVDFIKNILPNLGLVQMEKIINQVFEMDISKQLQAYEVEYHVLQDELTDSSLNDNQRMDKLEKANSGLRKQNFDLLEELQVANRKIHNLEVMVEALLHNEGKLKETVLRLERERKTLLETLQEFHTQPANPSGKTLSSKQERRDAAN